MTSPFEELELEVCVSLLPSDIGDIYAGIRRNIYQFLMKYNDVVGGVLLSVSNLSFTDGAREGRITDEMPHIHFNVKAKVQAFRPRPGHVLTGRVNKVTSTHVGMLVCGIFNASVVAEAMKDYTYDFVKQTWTSARGDVVGLGDETKFVVKRMHEAAGLISIEGSFSDLAKEEPSPENPMPIRDKSTKLPKKKRSKKDPGRAKIKTEV